MTHKQIIRNENMERVSETITEIAEVHVDIPDSGFMIHLPPGTTVHDRILGQTYTVAYTVGDYLRSFPSDFDKLAEIETGNKVNESHVNPGNGLKPAGRSDESEASYKQVSVVGVLGFCCLLTLAVIIYGLLKWKRNNVIKP